MMILLLTVSFAVLFVLVLNHLENRKAHLDALERYYREMGFRHHMDPKATIEDAQKYIEASQSSSRTK